MRSRTAALATSTGCLMLWATPAPGASPAGGSGVGIDVLAAVRGVLPRLERESGVAIRIPRTVYVFARRRVYATATASADGYDIELGFAPGCGGATACFAASFSGRRGGRAAGREAVRLAGGIVGRFTPISCGASCAPPEIQWVERGATYTLQLYARAGSDLPTLAGYADSAIVHRGL